MGFKHLTCLSLVWIQGEAQIVQKISDGKWDRFQCDGYLIDLRTLKPFLLVPVLA